MTPEQHRAAAEASPGQTVYPPWAAAAGPDHTATRLDLTRVPVPEYAIYPRSSGRNNAPPPPPPAGGHVRETPWGGCLVWCAILAAITLLVAGIGPALGWWWSS